MFTKDSIVPKIWAEAVMKGDRTIEEVPNLSNLIDVVNSILAEVQNV